MIFLLHFLLKDPSIVVFSQFGPMVWSPSQNKLVLRSELPLPIDIETINATPAAVTDSVNQNMQETNHLLS